MQYQINLVYKPMTGAPLHLIHGPPLLYQMQKPNYLDTVYQSCYKHCPLQCSWYRNGAVVQMV